jgi:glucans biosynthesis protein
MAPRAGERTEKNFFRKNGRSCRPARAVFAAAMRFWNHSSGIALRAAIFVSLCCCVLNCVAEIQSVDVTLDYVVKRAEERARLPFVSGRQDMPVYLRKEKLTPEQYRQIQFRHERALWRADRLPFRLEFFHPGSIFQDPVHLNEFTPGYVQPIRFTPDYFRYGRVRLPETVPFDTGYAGFRVLCRLNQPNKWDELGSFLGASYFRLLGQGQSYGQSARGLVVDCGEPDRAEEFPVFTDWWISKPRRSDNCVHLFGLLDSVSCTGAYEFYLCPGKTTVADVQAVIFLRQAARRRIAPRNLGLAPLTGMFWFGENSERLFDDYRPEVHDCDGLLMHLENDTRIWRPLNNASRTSHQIFPANNIRGFGLMQRDRDFNNYEDLSRAYQNVPSVWVVPHGTWGEGDVHLVELSTESEDMGNIVAFWSPRELPAPMRPLRFGYTLFWTTNMDAKISPDRVAATRIGLDPRFAGWRDFAIDFEGPQLRSLPKGAKLFATVSCTGKGAIKEQQVFYVPDGDFWRVIFKMAPDTDCRSPVDLSCTLSDGKKAIAETWSYRWMPP